jgi:ATP-dependent DNA helicase RecG
MDLKDSVTELPLVGPFYATKLEKLGITSIDNLLYHIPHRYLDFSKTSPIKSLQVGDTITLRGEIASIKNQYTRTGKKLQIAQIKDATGEIMAIWFNQPFLARVLSEGEEISMAGKVDWFGRKKALISPEYEKIAAGKPSLHTGRLIPIYPETAGLSSKWLRGRIQYTLSQVLDQINEYLPKDILDKENFPNLTEAITSIHFPSSSEDSEKARARLAFDELLMLQLRALGRKKQWQKNKSTYRLKIDSKPIDEFIKSLSFTLTGSQLKAWEDIKSDLKNDYPMNRLLEGDVGSGKTVVSAIATFVAFINGYQTVFMAPTQILAQQHFHTLEKLFEPFKLRVSLITSTDKKLNWGRSDVIVGTHSLLHNSDGFDKVALVVIDEQQKFGVSQREELIRKTKKGKVAPHLLTMTATPIPRTVALTYYGDLDLTTLKELPKGRIPISTWIVPPIKRKNAYTWIAEKITKEKIQAFVVCPLIEESEIETLSSVKSVKKEFIELQKVFKGFKLGLLHGRLKSQEKEKVTRDFREGKIDILVSTPVVEVGIDVPNANIMIVEGAERFGLASLHQLRGRVGRGAKKSYCLLFTEVYSNKVTTRLKAMENNLSGFELAELDLSLRGPGEVFGTKQHGFPELKIASWQDFDLIKKTKLLANKIITTPNKFLGVMAKVSEFSSGSN